VTQVRGRGLLLAAEIYIGGESDPAPKFVIKALEHGLLLNAVTPTAVRLAPALTIADTEMEQALLRWELTCNYFSEVSS